MESIVVTDGFTLNPGDLSWDRFDAFGEVTVRDRTDPGLVSKVCEDATVIITNKTPVDGAAIARAKRLKLVCVTATGFNVVDVDACTANNIPVCNVPGYGTDSVAQHTFSLLLELTNHVGLNSSKVNSGGWSESKDWCFTVQPIVELSGKIMGIVGYGRIGQKVAEIAVAFGMKVIYHNRSAKQGLGTQVSMEELFRTADVVSLHCPLQPDNHYFLNRALLSLMKPTALMINTARGQLINEQDLADTLKRNGIRGAALDVLSEEPPRANHPLVNLPNCIVTPHNAWLSFEARSRIMETTFRNVEAGLHGSAQNVVNKYRKL